MQDVSNEAKILAEQLTKREVKSIQVDRGSDFGRALGGILRDLGWTPYQSGSRCTVATYERHLVHPDKETRVEIISSNFLGVFTQVETYPAK